MSAHGSTGSTMAPKESPRTRRPHPLTVPQGGQWQPLSPTTMDRLLGGRGNGTFAEPLSPGGSPQFSRITKRDSRRAVLLYMIYANLFLALILVVLGGSGPGYPGHSGTVDNSFYDSVLNRKLNIHSSPLYEDTCPTSEVDTANASVLHSALVVGLVIWITQPYSAYTIRKQVDRRGAAMTLLTSIMCAFTSIGALVVVMVDISYIAGCCSLMEDNCEVSNLCTEFVDDCCIGDGVEEYCGTPSYHVGAVAMIFVVFVCTSAMLVMSVTITCRCWVDSDPEKQALMMVLATTPSVYSPGPGSRLSPTGSLSPKRFFSRSGALKPPLVGSLNLNANNVPLSSKSEHRQSTADGMLIPSRLPETSPRSADGSPRWRSSGSGRAGRAGGGGGGGSENSSGVVGIGAGESKSPTEICPVCGAAFGDVDAVVRHIDRFHGKQRAKTSNTPISIGGGGGDSAV